MTGRFNLHDPFQAEPVKLSRTALAGIAGSGQLPISPCSPLAVEPGAKDPAEPARAEALRALTPG
ncbi:MAG: hypothetical protein HY013_04685, partial [Candidatus Solibacter usitatus]|nr:hypothetical protein [Candidatus Solibacter usitatus]